MFLPLNQNVDKDRVFKYLGVTQSNPNIENMLAKASQAVLSTASGLVCYKRFDFIEPEIIIGQDIKKHLEGCFGHIVFAVTLTSATDKLIKKLTVTDKALAVVCDAVASVVCEQLEEAFTANLKESLKAEGLYLTKSYAPGYGDYPIEMVDEFLKKIEATKKIGITVSERHFMSPMKSIIAIAGISKTPTDGFRAGCWHCKLFADCKLRKEGKTCVR